ncbi:MAG: group II intron reverse transcriptase/maturase, partial [Verrucomicrobiae bacterium]|nr:group II intron reverse transcriptase/maturase [Verrucomicrobiae bacterium]
FEFLGFTHYWGISRKGRKVIQRKTARKRIVRTLKGMSAWCRENRHVKLTEQCRKIGAKLKGHYAYFGITGNGASLQNVFDKTKKIWHYWLNRRSRSRSDLNWERFGEMIEQFMPLPIPRVVHSIYAAKP